MHPYHHPLFVQFIVYFNKNQDYFECHEVLEEYWKSQEAFSKNHPLTAFILLSTGLYHWRRNNFTGAFRTLDNALNRFRSISSTDQEYLEEVDLCTLIKLVEQAKASIETNQPFKSFPLPVSPELSALADQQARSMELLPKNSDAVIYKHMLRDRSDILKKREEKKKARYY